MPCTYCGNPKHTRKQCEELSNDFQTYLKVSTLVREDYVERLTEKGIVPGAIVRTYNRTNNFMNKSSETPVKGIGNLDMFSCYSGPGKKAFANDSPTREHIVLDDDDERLVTPNHCYEIVQASDQDWETSFVTAQVLTEDEFKAMFKGKKRHIGFETSLFGCVVKKYTTHQETNEEMAARYRREDEEREAKIKNDEEQTGEPVYVITFTSTSDCYKRPHTDTWAKTAISFEDAKAICLQGYLEQASDWDIFDVNEKYIEGFLSAAKDTDDFVESVYDFFLINGDDLFKGEFVPVTFSIDISEETTSTCSTQKITELVEELVEILEEK
jgi:hypothetical protein